MVNREMDGYYFVKYFSLVKLDNFENAHLRSKGTLSQHSGKFRNENSDER